MADFMEDVGVGYYRSLDPPKNFAVKVKLRRVTAASYLPEFKIGSQQNINNIEGAEVAGEELEMATLRRDQDKQDQDAEECVFYWQQKMFSKREMELYEDLNNCFGPLEQKYHSEILKLRTKGGRPNNKLFSYVDCDSYVNVDEESRTLTTSPSEIPSYLAKNMSSVRRRNITAKIDRRHCPGGFAPRADPIVIHETETTKTAAHVVNIPYKTMHVMADLTPEGKATHDQEDEHVLFSVKIDVNGQIFVKPDFNGENPPHRIETCNDLREVYEYTIEQCSPQMTSDQREQEYKSFSELYNRHALYLASQVGSGFDPVPEPGVLRMNLFGEIVSARGFEYDGLYVHFFLDLPSKWRPVDDPVLSGVTQTCVTKLEGEENVAHFCYPFEFSLLYQEDDESADDFIHWPTLFIEVLSLDSWERFRTEGYTYLTIPSKAGSYTLEADTWRPIGNGPIPEMRRFFIGGSPELEDPTYPQKPAMTDDKVLSKYFFRTAASGSVTVKLHIMQQCQSFVEVTKKPRRTRTILDRLGGMNALDSLARVLDAFQRAKRRMLAAREGLPSIK
ncbi:Pleiotropic negative transcriptional regulator [Porites harrisoni]